MKTFISIVFYLPFLFFIFETAVSAHTPLFPANNHNPETAFVIKNSLKSWALYAALKKNEVDYYKMEFLKGQQIEISLMSAKAPSDTGFFPSMVLLAPAEVNNNKAPLEIKIPPGYSPILFDEKEPDRASFEPFSPGWFYELADNRITAPNDGAYYIAIYDKNRNAGNYLVAVGFIESFTFPDWIMIPVNAHSIYVWEGQKRVITWLPLILSLLFGALLLVQRKKHGNVTNDLSKMFAWFAGFAFIGTSVDRTFQLMTTIQETGFSAEITVTILFIIIGLIPGFLILKYASNMKAVLTYGRRLGLFMIGLLGLLVWSGVLLGPLLVFLAALMPKRLLI